MAVAPLRRDVFSAHEVVQLIPIYDRTSYYERFLDQNRWVRKIVPNMLKKQKSTIVRNNRSYRDVLLEACVWPINVFLKYVQLWYMRGRRTHEVIEDGLMQLHPRDKRVEIMDIFQKLRHSMPKKMVKMGQKRASSTIGS